MLLGVVTEVWVDVPANFLFLIATDRDWFH